MTSFASTSHREGSESDSDDGASYRTSSDADTPKILARGVVGEVIWFSRRKGFGFIRRRDNQEVGYNILSHVFMFNTI